MSKLCNRYSYVVLYKPVACGRLISVSWRWIYWTYKFANKLLYSSKGFSYAVYATIEEMNNILFYILLQLLPLLTAGNVCQNASQDTSDLESTPLLQFGVFISQNSSDSNSFDYAGFIPALDIAFETVMNSSSMFITDTGMRKYRINYILKDAMVRMYTRA